MSNDYECMKHCRYKGIKWNIATWIYRDNYKNAKGDNLGCHNQLSGHFGCNALKQISISKERNIKITKKIIRRTISDTHIIF